MRSRYLVLVLALVGCGPDNRTDNKPDGGGGGPPTLTSIDITPATVSLTTTSGGAAAAQQFVATAHYSDGTTADVSASVGWSLSDPGVGTVANGAFAGSATRGGVATVYAGDASVMGKATVTVKYVAARVSTDDGSTAPANAPTLFGGADDPTLAPQLAYPLDGAKVPHNLGLLEVQWKKPAAAADLFEVSLTADTLDFKLYTNTLLANGGRLSLKPDEWMSIADSVQGGAVKVQVRAVASANPAKVGSSVVATMTVGKMDVSGGIYYWSPAGAGQTGVVVRESFGDTSGTPQQFYAPSNGTRCVGCHVITRDGTKMAVTYDGGNGAAAVVSVPALNMVLAESTTQKWNFGSYSPDGGRMVAAGAGIVKVVDTSGGPQNGKTLQTIATGQGADYGTHPDWSADGSKIVYVQVAAPQGQSDWNFSQGSIVVVSDVGMGMFGNPKTIVASQNGQNNYYPSFSPDGKWVLFNRSADVAYNAGSAETYVVSVDGSIGPIPLGNANSTQQTVHNSWPRWNPFVVHEPTGDIMYLTYSSVRDYGIEIVQASLPSLQPQIWMAAFDPAKAAMGVDPSSTAFWMPFQDVKSHNHIAQWTATFIP
jgi:WD40 repeat protein